MPIVAFRLHYLFEKANTDSAVSFRVIEVERRLQPRAID
jgi:hypothetical protein